MPDGPHLFPPMRLAALLALWLVLPLAACAPSRLPLEVTSTRLAAAATPEARAAVAAERLADAGTTPLGDGRVRPRAAGVQSWQGTVAAFIPGRDPVLRTELVTVGVALDAPEAAALIEAARRLVRQSPHGSPHRSVMVALWRRDPAEVARMPVWTDSLRAPLLTLDAIDPAGLAGDALVARLAEAVLARADTTAAATVVAR